LSEPKSCQYFGAAFFLQSLDNSQSKCIAGNLYPCYSAVSNNKHWQCIQFTTSTFYQLYRSGAVTQE